MHLAIPDSNRTDRTSLGSPTACGHDIDTVALRIYEPIEPSVLRHLDHYEERRGDIGWLRSTARLRNLHLTATASGLRIRNGLAAFISGTNAAPFDHDAVLPAFAEIADAVGLPLSSVLAGRVTVLHVGVNVPVTVPVEAITGSMVAIPPSRLSARGRASTEVGHTTRGLYVYDKRAERGRRGVHPCYGDGPLSRVEHRYKKKLDVQFGRPVTAGRLCDRSFYEELGVRLVEATDALAFRRPSRIGAPQTPTELYRAYAHLGIEAAGGFEAALDAVGLDLRTGKLGENEAATNRASRLRTCLRGLRVCPEHSEPLDIAVEFRRAVHAAVFSGYV